MKRPDLLPGVVIRYDFLWAPNSQEDRIEGDKERPCLVIAKRRDRQALIAPITHRAPEKPDHAFPIPGRIARALGLDERQSWLRVNEVNLISPDAQIIPVSKTKWEYGQVEHAFWREAFDRVRTHYREGTLNIVHRTDDELEHESPLDRAKKSNTKPHTADKDKGKDKKKDRDRD